MTLLEKVCQGVGFEGSNAHTTHTHTLSLPHAVDQARSSQILLQHSVSLLPP